jgi:hypothetical protein
MASPRRSGTIQDRWIRFRKYRAPLPRIAYADTPAIRAYVNAVRYRKYRPLILAAVLAYMLARRLSR